MKRHGTTLLLGCFAGINFCEITAFKISFRSFLMQNMFPSCFSAAIYSVSLAVTKTKTNFVVYMDIPKNELEAENQLRYTEFKYNDCHYYNECVKNKRYLSVHLRCDKRGKSIRGFPSVQYYTVSIYDNVQKQWIHEQRYNRTLKQRFRLSKSIGSSQYFSIDTINKEANRYINEEGNIRLKMEIAYMKINR